MKIYVLSYKRSGMITKRFSINQIPDNRLKDVILVVREDEKDLYKKTINENTKWRERGLSIHSFIPDYSPFGWGDTMDYIIDHAINEGHERCIIMDDDLVFCNRNITPFEWAAFENEMIKTNNACPVMSCACERLQYEHLNIVTMKNDGKTYALNNFIARFWSFYLPFFKENNYFRFRMGDGPFFISDIWFAMHLYYHGFNSKILLDVYSNHIDKAGGGCDSLGRNDKSMSDSMDRIISRFPMAFPYLDNSIKNTWQYIDYSVFHKKNDSNCFDFIYFDTLTVEEIDGEYYHRHLKYKEYKDGRREIITDTLRKVEEESGNPDFRAE